MTMTQADLILGIETTCDDTSIALVRQNGDVLACETVSQFEIHAAHGGVFPELASRAHVQAILPTVQRVMATIDNDRARIRAIGVSRGPGLIGSILVGVNTATGLGLAWGVPVIGVNHLRGHLRSAALEGQTLPYPAVVLLASGGHTILSHMASAQDMAVLGQTRDDSIGECYDKVARMLGLGMPGGPAVDMAALEGTPRYPLPRPMRGAGYEFSFSGLKSSVARLLEKEPEAAVEDVAASFVAACLDILQTKLDRAIGDYAPKSLVIVGGVAASRQIRAMVQSLCAEHGITACLPALKWSTDNAAMIGFAAWDSLDTAGRPIEITPNLPLTAL